MSRNLEGRDEVLHRCMRIVNRSQRVWIYGFLRMVPMLMLVSFCFLSLLSSTVKGYGQLMAFTFVALIVAMIVADRSTLLDPVDVIWIGEILHVKRLVSKRRYPINRIRQIIISPMDNHDYDDLREYTAHVTFHLGRFRRASLLVSLAAAHVIVNWAKERHLPIVDLRQAEFPPEQREREE